MSLSHCLKYAFRIGFVASITLLPFNALAIGLGEIKVSSGLGEPLQAEIEVLGSPVLDANAIKVRLASFQTYKSKGLTYPDEAKFRFQLFNEYGSKPVIRVSSTNNQTSFFVDLLVEIHSPAGDLAKAYTFLLDPPVDLSAVSDVSSNLSASSLDGLSKSTQPIESVLSDQLQVTHSKPDTSNKRHSKHSRPAERPAHIDRVKIQPVEHKPAKNSGTSEQSFGRNHSSGQLSLKMSTSLSISKEDFSDAGRLTENRDRLQEELIVKEKTLNDLNEQIAEMQLVIRTLQGRLGKTDAESSLALSKADALLKNDSVVGHAKTSDETIQSEPAAFNHVSQAKAATWYERVGRSALILWVSLILLLTVIAVWLINRKRHSQAENSDESYDLSMPLENQMGEYHSTGGLKVSSHVREEKFSRHDDPDLEQTVRHVAFTLSEMESTQHNETPSHVSHDSIVASSVNTNEFVDFNAMIEEAEIYAIHGHPFKAIEILNSVIFYQPKNVEVWLQLLSIFCNKKNLKQFEKIAIKFHDTVDDKDAWKRVQEAGRSIDPDNNLYFDPNASGYIVYRNITIKNRRLLGEILFDMGAISSTVLVETLEKFDPSSDGCFGDFLRASGLISAQQLEDALQLQAQSAANDPLEFVNSAEMKIDQFTKSEPHLIGDVLIQMGMVNEYVLQHVLEDFDPVRHGRCGSYLVSRGVITNKQLQRALLRQLSGALAIDVQLEEECDIALDFPHEFSEEGGLNSKPVA